MDLNQHFEVEKILGKRTKNGKVSCQIALIEPIVENVIIRLCFRLNIR